MPRSRAVGATVVLLLGIAFCFVMYWWQLQYRYSFHDVTGNLYLAVPFAGLAAMSIELRSARTLTPAGRADLFNAAYEGYVMPFHIDEQQLAFMDNAFDLDLDASQVAFRDGEPVGLANLGLRGEDAWIGGVGVVSAARRTGVGEALMRGLHEQARERGVRRVWLEVIVENSGALALYEKLGYRTVRDVEVWSLPLAVSERTEAED